MYLSLKTMMKRCTSGGLEKVKSPASTFWMLLRGSEHQCSELGV